MLRLNMRALQIGVAVAVVLALCASPALSASQTLDQETSGGAMIYDLIILRPAGIIAQAVGAVFFVVTLPFSAIQGNADVAAEKLLYDPARYTWARPIGELENW